MVQYANVIPNPPVDDAAYALAVAMPGAEADLGQPVPLPWAAAVAAAVEFSTPLPSPGGTAYVVMQTDLGDGVWFDVAWAVWLVNGQSSANFLLSGGVAGANAFQQTRAVGTAPGSSGSNQCPLMGRVRFVGKWGGGSSSSSSSPGGLVPVGQITVTVRYKILGLR